MAGVTIVVLAKSYKPAGRCLAGKVAVLDGSKKLRIGEWFRPVPNDGVGAIPEGGLVYSNGSPIKVLDVVELDSLGPVSVPGQPENHRYDQNIQWRYIGRFRHDCIGNLIDAPSDIWLEAGQPTNKVTAEYDRTVEMTHSLYLIKPENFLVTLKNTFNMYKAEFQKKLTASFDYNGIRYEDLSITCPSTRRILTNQYPTEGEEEKTFPLKKGDDYYLCVSLTPRFGTPEFHYKLVATIFDFDGYLQRTYAA